MSAFFQILSKNISNVSSLIIGPLNKVLPKKSCLALNGRQIEQSTIVMKIFSIKFCIFKVTAVTFLSHHKIANVVSSTLTKPIALGLLKNLGCKTKEVQVTLDCYVWLTESNDKNNLD